MSRSSKPKKPRGKNPWGKTAAKRRGKARPTNEPAAKSFAVPRPEHASAPVWIDRSGQRVVDPYVTLGLSPDAKPGIEEVEAVFRERIAETPPETDPERARDLVEARAVLLDRKHALTRIMGDLRVPEPSHFVEDFTPSEVDEEAAKPGVVAAPWSAHARLMTLLVLYSLVEEEIENGSVRQELLF